MYNTPEAQARFIAEHYAQQHNGKTEHYSKYCTVQCRDFTVSISFCSEKSKARKKIMFHKWNDSAQTIATDITGLDITQAEKKISDTPLVSFWKPS